jgi:hypothetical protein
MRKLLPFLLLAVSLFAQDAPAPLSAAKKHELFDLRSSANEDVKKFQSAPTMDQLNKDQAAAKKAQDALSNLPEWKAVKKASDAVDADVAKVKESPEFKALQAKQDVFKKAQDAASSGVDLKKWQLDQDFDWVPVTPVQSTQEKK